MEYNERNMNSALFLGFIKRHGFNPENYGMIVELVQNAPASMSQFLKEYKQFLLSEKVNYSDINKLGIKGAQGYLGEDELVIPRTPANDVYFKNLYINQNKKAPGKHLKYPHLVLEKNDVIIANGFVTDLFNLINVQQDIYVGYCLDDSDINLGYQNNGYYQLFDFLDKKYPDDYSLTETTLNDGPGKNKQLLLIEKNK